MRQNMNLPYSKLLRWLLLLAFMCVCPLSQAQDAAATYPNKPIKIISPFAPGGATDILARILAQKLGDAWKQSVIVDNKAGGGGVIAAGEVARAEKDGYTLLLGSVGPVEVLPSVMKKVSYDSERDFAGVDILVNVENVVVVNNQLPVKNISELIAYAKANPGKLHSGSSGIATTGHLSLEVFNQIAGTDIVHVPYRGGAPVTTALLAGDIQMSFSTVPASIQYIKSGKLRAIAVTGDKPLETLPGIKPIKDQGVPGFKVSSWYGILAPSGTPPAIINKINLELGKIIAMPDVKAKLLEQGWTTVHTTPAQMNKQIQTEIQDWKVVINKAGITLD
jgi:tripartite-type tricarboxylate transporter receptor subunit TctC